MINEEKPLRLSIYIEVIHVNNNDGGFYRVVLTDQSMETTYPFLAKFDNYVDAEIFAGKIGATLARFGGQYRSKSLLPKNN